MFLGLLLNRYVIAAILAVLLVVGGFAYFKITSNIIRDLRQQVAVVTEQEKMLEATDRALVDDINRIQQAQTEANRKLEDVRLASIEAMRALMQHKYDASDLPALQGQVNKDMADMLARLGRLSHAP